MHYAARYGHSAICSLLLEKGADIAATNNVSDAQKVEIYRTCMPSRAHTYTSPPPGDRTLPYLPPYITFCAYCIFSLPHYPPLFLPIPSFRTPMVAIIACYRVDAHYHQRGGHVCMRAWHVCMRKEGFSVFSLFRIAFSGSVDCGPVVRGRI